jgi:heme/copper-type cytochrome/quinol oxidase subunit 2
MFRTKACVIAALGAALSVSIMILGGSAWAQSAQYTLIVRHHEFQPTELQLPAGQKIELRVTNADPTPEEFESPSLNREKVIPGGQTVTIYIGPLTPGRYEFFGDFNPKTARGTIVAK